MATITWVAGVIGDWSTPADWVGGVVPGAADTALFAAGALNVATIDAGATVAAANVILAGNNGSNTDSSQIDILGTLALAGTLSLGQNASIFSLTSNITNGHGVISGGTLDLTGGGNLREIALDGVTVVGTPTVNHFFFESGTIEGGLTSLITNLAIFGADFVGNQTLTAITIDTGTSSLSGTLTIAAGSTVSGGDLWFTDAAGGGALVNDGTIIDTTGTTPGGSASLFTNLTNAGLLRLTGTYGLSGALANSGTLIYAGAGYLASTGAVSNSGLLEITAAGTLQLASLDNTGGTLSLDAGTQFTVTGAMTGGTLVAAGGTGPVSGTLDSVSLAGSLSIFEGTFAGGTGFVSTQGARATATIDVLNLAAAAQLDNVNMTLSMLGVNQPGSLIAAAALTLGAASDLAFQNTDTLQPSVITAAGALTLNGTIEATAANVSLTSTAGAVANAGLINLGSGELFSLLTQQGGGIDNSGTIAVAAGGTLSIGTTGAFSNEGTLQLAAGSTLELSANLSAASFAGLLQSGVTLVFDGTVTGGTAPGDGTITLPAGAIVPFGGAAVLRDLTVIDDTPTTFGGTLDGVTWQGQSLDVSNQAQTVVRNGLSVLNAAGGPGTIVIGGTNSILNLQTDTTLDNVNILVGSTLAGPGTATFSVIDGTNPTLGTDSNLTIGAKASVTINGNNTFNGLNNIGTLIVAGTITLGTGGGGGAPALGSGGSRAASSEQSAGPAINPNQVQLEVLGELGLANLDDIFGDGNLTDEVIVRNQTTSDTGQVQETGLTLANLRNVLINHNSNGLAIRSGSAVINASTAVAPTELTTANETTIDGTGTIFVGNQSVFGLNAIIGSEATLAFEASSGIFALFDPANVKAKIVGFGAGDAIDLGYDGYTGAAATYSNGQLSIQTANGTVALNLQFAAGYSAANVQLADDSQGGTFAYIPGAPACFAEGTRIATLRGPVAVEALRPGDRVVLAIGGSRPVLWTGHRRIACARHPRPWDVNPVRIRAHAFGQGRPWTDLRVSPDHALLINAVLIPARYLLNDRTILQEPVETITYWHVELDRHDVLLAEGLAAESYLDTGNRGAFAEADPVALHPDFAPDAMEIWARDACAPLVRDGAALAAARGLLLARAAALGHRMTRDAGLHLLHNGRIIRPKVSGGRHQFRLPAGARGVRLISRHGVPAHLHAAHADHRRLGVAVSAIRLNGTPIALADPRLGAGWQAPEQGGPGTEWRWTTGDAALDLDPGTLKPATLTIDVLMTEHYWQDDVTPATARSARD